MPSIFDKLKEGADKAAFEADRLRRLNQAQAALRTLQRQLETQMAALGQQVLALYGAGALTQSEMLTVCQQQIDPLRQQIADQEAEIERIRQEKPLAPAVPAAYGHICPRCQIQLPTEAGFCPRCGSPAVDVAPPLPPAGKTCAQCGAGLAAEAIFCARCGTPVRVVAPPPAPTCPACHKSIPAEAVFCPNCGASLGASATEAAPNQISCPTCRASIPVEAVFCPECGRSITSAPPRPSGQAAPPQAREEPDRIIRSLPSVQACPNCRASIPVEAVFCPECGTPIESAPVEAIGEEASPEEDRGSAEDQVRPLSEAVEMENLPGEEKTSPHTACPFCQASIPAEAEFCPECGKPIPSAPAEPE